MIVAEDSLPTELDLSAAVAAAYPTELAAAEETILRQLALNVECDKELVPYFYKVLRDRLKAHKIRCIYLDGRPNGGEGGPPQGIVATMIGQLRDVVRSGVATGADGDERVCVVLPHLDLLVTSQGGLTTEAREVIPLMYENPLVLWMGFKDPSFALPEVMNNLFPRHITIMGIQRDRLAQLVTRREARKFGKTFDPYALYKHVSGVNVIRLRRMLTSLTGEDYPDNARPAYDQIRSATVGSSLTLPDVDLKNAIGGYPKVKDQLQKEILDVLSHKDTLASAEAVKNVEGLLPRGMIFWGPPGTGKTLFAKGMATALGAAVIIVSGPELKSKWVGESEERIRQIFIRARQSAPAIIIFDELDSFASARGTYTGSGVEHSMVNQLLTEMDGFRKDELVFVVGTTNFVESLDPALLRPGRFEFHLHIPYPDEKDRRAILGIYNTKLDLNLTEAAIEFTVRRSGEPLEGMAPSADGSMPRWSGDHIQALCRQLARMKIREKLDRPLDTPDVERALTQYMEFPNLTPAEEKIVATHECGHAMVAMHCTETPAIDRISIRSDIGFALGYVKYKDDRKLVVSHDRLKDIICTLFGGREAEAIILDKLHVGSSQDIDRATHIARALIVELGASATSGATGRSELGVRTFGDPKHDPVSNETQAQIDAAVKSILDTQQQRARKIILDHKDELLALRDLLLQKKVLEVADLDGFKRA